MIERPKQMRGDVDPRKIFYIALSADFDDGSAAVDWDGSKGFQDLGDTIEHAKEQADEYNAESIILECCPIKLVKRGEIRVSTITPKK